MFNAFYEVSVHKWHIRAIYDFLPHTTDSQFCVFYYLYSVTPRSVSRKTKQNEMKRNETKQKRKENKK